MFTPKIICKLIWIVHNRKWVKPEANQKYHKRQRWSTIYLYLVVYLSSREAFAPTSVITSSEFFQSSQNYAVSAIMRQCQK